MLTSLESLAGELSSFGNSPTISLESLKENLRVLIVFGLHGVSNCGSEGAYDEVRLFAESIGILRIAQVLAFLKVIETVCDCYHFNYYKQPDFFLLICQPKGHRLGRSASKIGRKAHFQEFAC